MNDRDVISVTTVLVSANPLLCLGLKSFLTGTQFKVLKDPVHNVSDIPALPADTPALFIVDGSHNPDGALELIRALKACCPSGRAVLMADRFEPYTLVTAQEAGTDGLFLTVVDQDVLVRSLELVMLGEIVAPSALIWEILNRSLHSGAAPDRSSRHSSDQTGHKLSCREMEILHCLTEGSPNKVIARQLHLCEATVKVHIKAILRKIGVFNRTQAAMWAADHMPNKVEPPGSRRII